MTGRLLLLLLLFLPGSLVSRLVRSFGECKKKKKKEEQRSSLQELERNWKRNPHE